MKYFASSAVLIAILFSQAAVGESPFDFGKKAVSQSAQAAVQTKINKRLMAESRKNQCSFRTDSDQLLPGCDAKMKRMASTIIEARRTIDNAGIKNYRFEIGYHHDTRGDQERSKELTQKRAQVIMRELVSRGIQSSLLIAVGYGAERPLVKPDNTPAKQVKNRRYEIIVKL